LNSANALLSELSPANIVTLVGGSGGTPGIASRLGRNACVLVGWSDADDARDGIHYLVWWESVVRAWSGLPGRGLSLGLPVRAVEHDGGEHATGLRELMDDMDAV
jgi:hypothetical protein